MMFGVSTQPRFELYRLPFVAVLLQAESVLDEKTTASTSCTTSTFFRPTSRTTIRSTSTAPEGRRNGGAPSADRVSGYTGRSSTESEGSTRALCSTLVDHETGRVLVNSKRMCMYLDGEVDRGTQLVPPDIAAEVIRNKSTSSTGRRTWPCSGRHPGNDPRPAFVRHDMPGVHDLSAKLRDNMAQAGDDPLLIKAYESKIAKESAAKRFVRTSKTCAARLRSSATSSRNWTETLPATGADLAVRLAVHAGRRVLGGELVSYELARIWLLVRWHRRIAAARRRLLPSAHGATELSPCRHRLAASSAVRAPARILFADEKRRGQH